jgi:hypothetical protein
MQPYSYIKVQNLSLAAALLSIGIPFDEATPFITTKKFDGASETLFFFQENSICGQYSTMAMINAWNDNEFHIKNPEHPFAYIACAFKNRDGLLDKVKQSAEMVVIEKNGKLAVISKAASIETQTKIFSQL